MTQSAHATCVLPALAPPVIKRLFGSSIQSPLASNSKMTKNPKLIANLVKDGNFGMPYLPEQLYADLRRLSMFRDQLNEDRIRSINRLHRELKIYFPEYKEALRKTEGTFSLELLKQEPFPDDLATLKEDGIDRSGIMRNLEDAGIAELEKS